IGLGNGSNGVEIRNDSTEESVLVEDNVIGGVDADDGEEDGIVKARNIISGILADGIHIAGHRTLANRIQGNYIGTDEDGLNAVGNEGDGIHLTTFVGQTPDSTTLIGGQEPGAGNIISGNVNDGLFIGFGARAVATRNVINKPSLTLP